MLLDDNRRAGDEVILERTGERDSEDKDGDLPQLERRGRRRNPADEQQDTRAARWRVAGDVQAG